jgi:polyadenylate-binding protein
VSGRSLGYAYVNFQDTESAERAISALNFSEIHGRQCRVCWSRRDASQRRSGAANLYVKNLPADMDNLTFQTVFSKFGDIVSSKVSVDAKTGKCLGYGFVNFDSEDVAKTVVAASPIDHNGTGLVVMAFKSQKERGSANSAFTNIYVKELPEAWGKDELDKHFGQFGTITSSAITVSAHPTSTGRKFGFINFATHEQAQNAIEQSNAVEVDGKKIYAVRAQSKSERDRQKREVTEARRAERIQKFASCNLYVKFLPDDVTDEMFKEVFGKCGTITSCLVNRSEDGRSTGVGFVCYASPDEATKAITELNQSSAFGTAPIFVTLHQSKVARMQQRHANMWANPMRGANAGYFPHPAQMGPGMVMMPGPFMGKQGMHGPGGMYPMGPMGGNFMGRGQRMPRHFANGPNGPRSRPPRQQQGGQGRRGPRAPVSGGAAVPGQFDATTFASLRVEDQRNYLGELLFPKVTSVNAEQAPKITGMLIEMDATEVIKLLHSEEELVAKINEALDVLRDAKEL